MPDRRVCSIDAVATTIAAVMLAGSAASASTVFIHDTEMAPAAWTDFAVNPQGGFAYTAGQSSGGGNPGAYRTISHSSVSGIASGLVVHLHQCAYAGSLGEVGMSVDVNCFNGGTSAAVAFGLVIEQGGVIYYGPSLTALTSSGWRTDLRVLQAPASSFVGLGGSPDFSGGGGPLRFGFYSGNGTGSGVPISSLSGADNFVVTLFPPPCPADFNIDGVVDTADLVRFLGLFGGPTPAGGPGDFNSDAVIDTADLVYFLGRFGQAC